MILKYGFLKYTTVVIALFLISDVACSQTALSVLERASSCLDKPSGVAIAFHVEMGSGKGFDGTVYVKNEKFHLCSSDVDIWFDGKTQWTYMKGVNEVNISTPSSSDQQVLNPKNLINIYKEGYSSTVESLGKDYEVHLNATSSSKRIKEMYVKVDKMSYRLKEIRMLQGSRWMVITVSDVNEKSLSNDFFVFDAKSYSDAEIIDLR